MGMGLSTTTQGKGYSMSWWINPFRVMALMGVMAIPPCFAEDAPLPQQQPLTFPEAGQSVFFQKPIHIPAEANFSTIKAGINLGNGYTGTCWLAIPAQSFEEQLNDPRTQAIHVPEETGFQIVEIQNGYNPRGDYALKITLNTQPVQTLECKKSTLYGRTGQIAKPITAQELSQLAKDRFDFR